MLMEEDDGSLRQRAQYLPLFQKKGLHPAGEPPGRLAGLFACRQTLVFLQAQREWGKLFWGA